MNKFLLGLMVASTAVVATASAFGAEFRAAPGVPPAHPAFNSGYEPFVNYVAEETKGQHTITLYGPEVVSLPQVKDSLESGLIQIGLLLPLYFPAEFPQFSLPSEIALLGRQPHAMSAAITEYMVTCAPCVAEMKNKGMVYLGTGSTAVYHLITTKPVRTLEDLKGLRLRSGGAPWSRWAEEFGAVPVSLPVGEIFESMAQGAIDGAITSLGDLLSFRLVELAKYVNTVPLGTYHANGMFIMSQEKWAGLSAVVRQAFARAANRANGDVTDGWAYNLTAAATNAAQKAGIEFVEPTPELLAASDKFAREDVDAVGDLLAARFDMKDTGPQAERFLALVDKWNVLLADVGQGDAQKVAEIVQQEVWSKVDFSTYGM